MTVPDSEQPAHSSATVPPTGFQREDRHLVLKYKDIAGAFETGAISEADLDVLSKISGEVEAYRMQRRNTIGEFFSASSLNPTGRSMKLFGR